MSVSKLPEPFIQRVPYNQDFEGALVAYYDGLPMSQPEQWSTYQLDWPTVYVVRCRFGVVGTASPRSWYWGCPQIVDT